MGINMYKEDERGKQLAELLDPRGHMGNIVSLAGHEHTTCLRFIDPYGDTVFNQLQIPVLIRELEAARDLITDESVSKLGQQALERARRANWAAAVIQSIESSIRLLSADDIRAHLEGVLRLARQTQGEAHRYLKIYGD